MRLDINLATRPYEDAQRFWVQWGSILSAVGLLTLILVFMALSGLWSASNDRKTIRSYQKEIAERDSERAQAEAFLNLPANRSTRDRSQFLNELIRRKSFSWTKVFEDLERIMPPRVHLVSIHPELNEDNQLAIKMQVAGDSRERALDLVRRMESSPHFQQTKIDSESQQAQNEGVSLDITAVYTGDRARGGTP
jgi:type IV pilus assembly protein PilN